MELLYRILTKLDQLDKDLDRWIKKSWRRAMAPIQFAIWLEILLLALMLEILKAAVSPYLIDKFQTEVMIALPSPIHQLPTELMIKILLFALEGTDWKPNDLQRLASVCKYWRGIILNDSRFWRVIDSRHSRHYWPFVLRRNRAGPLDVHIRGREGRGYNIDIVAPLMRLITPESRRIRSLSFAVMPNTPYVQSFFENTSLSSLTSLTVSVRPETALPISIHIGDGIPLRHLSLDSAVISWGTPRLRGLETLSLSNLNHDIAAIAHLHHILSSTPFLRQLSLTNWNAQLMPGDLTTQEISPITLPLLTDVEVQGLPEDVNSRLLSMLDLPSLRGVFWITADGRTVESSPALLHLCAHCIKEAPELVISWRRCSWALSIISKKWTSTPIRHPALEPGTSVNLCIRINTFRLMREVAMLLTDSNSVLFETDSKKSAKRARKIFLRSGAFFAFNVTRASYRH